MKYQTGESAGTKNVHSEAKQIFSWRLRRRGNYLDRSNAPLARIHIAISRHTHISRIIILFNAEIATNMERTRRRDICVVFNAQQ